MDVAAKIEELRTRKQQAGKDFGLIQVLDREINRLLLQDTLQDTLQDEGEPLLDVEGYDLLDPLSQRWSTSHVPDFSIQFRCFTGRDYIQCYQTKSFLSYINRDQQEDQHWIDYLNKHEVTDFRLWVPNGQRQLIQLDVDPHTGHGGMPSAVERYVRLPDSNLILIDEFIRDLKVGQPFAYYLALPLYPARFGNALSNFEPGTIHGQYLAWVYQVLPVQPEQRLEWLDRCLRRHIHVRDPFGHAHYDRLYNEVLQEQSDSGYVEAIRAVVERFPIPVMDLMRDYDRKEILFRTRFEYGLQNMVAPRDMANMIHRYQQKKEQLEISGRRTGTLFIDSSSSMSLNTKLKLQIMSAYRTGDVCYMTDSVLAKLPKPLASAAALKEVLQVVNVIIVFRWDVFCWAPVVVLEVDNPEVFNSDTVQCLLPEMTDRERELLLLQRLDDITLTRYRFVTSNSSLQELELLEFSMVPRTACSQILALYCTPVFFQRAVMSRLNCVFDWRSPHRYWEDAKLRNKLLSLWSQPVFTFYQFKIWLNVLLTTTNGFYSFRKGKRTRRGQKWLFVGVVDTVPPSPQPNMMYLTDTADTLADVYQAYKTQADFYLLFHNHISHYYGKLYACELFPDYLQPQYWIDFYNKTLLDLLEVKTNYAQVKHLLLESQHPQFVEEALLLRKTYQNTASALGLDYRWYKVYCQ